MLDKMSNEQLLKVFLKYQERFDRTVASGTSRRGHDIAHALNADVVFWECRRRGLVDEDGRVKA